MSSGLNGCEAGRTLAQVVRYSGPMLTRFLAGFNETSRTAQAPSLPNHTVWTLGHCAFVMGRLAERSGGPSLPDSEFRVGDGTGHPLTSEAAEAFDIETIVIGSTPTTDATAYPSLARSIEVFESCVSRLADTFDAIDEATLADTAKWGSQHLPRRDLAARVAIRNATHAGQLCDLRRALGLPRFIG